VKKQQSDGGKKRREASIINHREKGGRLLAMVRKGVVEALSGREDFVLRLGQKRIGVVNLKGEKNGVRSHRGVKAQEPV